MESRGWDSCQGWYWRPIFDPGVGKYLVIDLREDAVMGFQVVEPVGIDLLAQDLLVPTFTVSMASIAIRSK